MSSAAATTTTNTATMKCESSVPTKSSPVNHEEEEEEKDEKVGQKDYEEEEKSAKITTTTTTRTRGSSLSSWSGWLSLSRRKGTTSTKEVGGGVATVESSTLPRRKRKEKPVSASAGGGGGDGNCSSPTLPVTSTHLNNIQTTFPLLNLSGNNNNMAVALVTDATAAVWHAFDFLDDHKSGQVPKSKLKVLTANLGTVLNCPNVENGLQDYKSTSHLSFDDYMYYLRKELFSVTSSCVMDSRDHNKYLAHIEEVCWLVCHSKYLKRDGPMLPDQCVFKLFRVFCLLAEQIPNSNSEGMITILSSDEVEYVVRLFVLALGKDWDPKDFKQIAEVVPTFKFSVFLALLENSYAKNIEVMGLMEATQEIFDMFIEDVLKKSFLSKKGQFFSSWRLNWYVLRPTSLIYFNDRSEKEKRGEIPIHGKCSVEPLSDSPGSRGNRFILICGDKCFELSAGDHKTKLQWITAIQTAIDHHGHKESYQKLLATRRRNDRENVKSEKQENEQSLVLQQDLLEKQRSELEAERLARVAAETNAREQAALRERETQRLQEVEAAKKELERLLEEEKQAKRDEEIVRNLQARLLREEWEKREELERLQEEQRTLLTEERNKREGLEQQQQLKEKQLEDARKKLQQLEDEKGRLDRHFKETRIQLVNAEKKKQILEIKLRDAHDKMVVAERAKEVLEAKLRVREKSFIPLPIRSNVTRSPQNIGESTTLYKSPTIKDAKC